MLFFNKTKSILKLVIFASFSLWLLSTLPLFTDIKTPFEEVPVHAESASSGMNILNFNCFFPEDGDKCNNGGDPLLTNVTNLLINASYSIAVLVIIWGGYQYFFQTTSDNNEQGKKTIQAGVIGLVIITLARIIRNSEILQDTFSGDGFSAKGIVEIVTQIMNVAIPLAGVVAVFYLILGGYYMITGAETGGKDNVEKGKNAIKNAVIGLIVVLLATTIVQLINIGFNSM